MEAIMAAKSHSRGHQIEYRGKRWYYTDTGAPMRDDRPCIRCGKPPTPEGHDACLGILEGVTAACCGHGVCEPGIVRGA